MPMMEISREEAIDNVLAKDALREIAMRYCRAIDRHDDDLLRSVYHPDAIDDHGAAYCGDVEGFILRLHELMVQFEVTAHHIANTSYRIAGDKADGELYFTAYHRTRGEGAKHIIMQGRYLDNYERRDGVWKIAARRLVWDSQIVLDVNGDDDRQFRALGIAGATTDDLSYAALPLMGRGR